MADLTAKKRDDPHEGAFAVPGKRAQHVALVQLPLF